MKAAFIRRVMQIMNEAGWEEFEPDGFVGSDTTRIEKHVACVFVDAWRKAVNVLPVYYFSVKDFSGCELVGDFHTGCGYVVLPPDFYKLVRFKLARWLNPVSIAYSSSHPIAQMQGNEYVRGSVVRPVCLLKERFVAGGESALVLEYYSLPKGCDPVVEEALYIPLIGGIDEVDEVSERLCVPLAYLCAGLIYQIFEKPEIGEVLESRAIEISNEV